MDARVSHRLDIRPFPAHEDGSIGRISRWTHPVHDLLQASGGYQFMVICLCLLSLTVGIVFHRSVYSIYVQGIELPELLRENGYRGVSELDRLLISLTTAERSQASIRGELKDVRETSERLRSLVEETQSGLGRDSPTEAKDVAASAALARFDALLDLVSKLETGGLDPADLAFPYRLFLTELRATRSAYLSFLDEVTLAEDRLRQHLKTQMTFLAWCFWIFLTFSAFAGAAFLRLLRDEVTQRIARERAECGANYQAYYDITTGLANRFQFDDRLGTWITSAREPTLILVDIDRFYRFNDCFGRVSGDVVLKELAFRLRKLADRCDGFAARLAGDDFALVIGEKDHKCLHVLSREITDSCQLPVARAGQNLMVSVSVGVAPFAALVGEANVSQERLVSMATFALDSAKAKGGGGIEIFDLEISKRFLDRRAIAARLPRAIENGEVQMFFQPQFDLERNCIYGFEALARWFIDETSVPILELTRIAEAEGQIGDFDRFMLAEAIRSISNWNRSHRTRYSVSVNVSALNVSDLQIVDFIASCLDANALPASLLTIEVTESIELDHAGKAIETLQKLRSLGCRVSVDDFGTGYSSLGYLRGIEIDEVKIDRAFVADIDKSASARSFLQSVLQLPDSMGHSVVLEGIETAPQRDAAQALGARRIQGFLIGRPRPALEWLAQTTYRGRTKLVAGNDRKSA